MNIVDIIIVLFVLTGAYLGFNRGIITQTISFVGFIVIFLVAYFAKDYLAFFLCKWLPFININLGTVKSIQVLNILFYELIAFLIIFAILMALFKYLMLYTEVFEAILKNTIVLALPLKIGGLIVGAIEYAVITLIAVAVLMSPTFKMKWVQDSRLANLMVDNAKIPLLPIKEIVNTIEGLSEVKNIDANDRDKAELQILDLMLQNRVVKLNLVEELVKMGKIKVKNIDTIINKYKN